MWISPVPGLVLASIVWEVVLIVISLQVPSSDCVPFEHRHWKVL